MKSFITGDGEKAYVPTKSEKELIQVALRQLKATLPVLGEGLDG